MTARGEAGVEAREERAPRPERGEGEGRRGPRGERGERAERGERRPAPVAEGGVPEGTEETPVAQPFVDTVPVGEGAEAQQGERTGRRRRRGRGGRDRDEAGRETSELNGAEAPLAADVPVEPMEGTAAAEGEAPFTPAAEGEERDSRRRRGRGDRQRRERREGDVAPATEAALVESSVLGVPETVEPAEAAVPIAAAVTTVAPAPAAAPVEPTVQATAVVERFVLPESDLNAIAQGAGLEWINSDAEKIRAAQEAIASEPKPVHVPRERKPLVRVDEGPLVLVETRKDLAQITLPFDQPQQGAATPQ